MKTTQEHTQKHAVNVLVDKRKHITVLLYLEMFRYLFVLPDTLTSVLIEIEFPFKTYQKHKQKLRRKKKKPLLALKCTRPLANTTLFLFKKVTH